MPVTPISGVNSAISIGGSPVIAVAANPIGGFITNPLLAVDQGIATAEVLYINPAVAAGVVANGTTFAIQPGQSWNVIPGQTTPTSANANTPGHKFSVTSW